MVILLTNLNNKTNKLNENFFDKIIIKETKSLSDIEVINSYPNDIVILSDSEIIFDSWKYNIDFDIESFDFEYDPFYDGLIDMMKTKTENGTLTHDENQMFRRLMREANNVALHTLIKMRAVKE